MFIARAQNLKFVGDYNKVSHSMWLAAEELVKADEKGMGILAPDIMTSVVAESYDKAARMLCEMVGEALATHYRMFDPNDFRFSVVFTEDKNGQFWNPDTSRDGGNSIPVYKPKKGS